MDNKRQLWADVLKGWLIILVVLGHVIQSVEKTSFENNIIWNIIYSFHMPTFVAISGYFSYRNYEPKVSMLFRRFFQLLVPYFVWSLLKFAKSENYSFEMFSYIILQPDYYFWFLWAIFFIFVLLFTAKYISYHFKINENYPIMVMGLVLLFIMVKLDFRLFGFQFISYYYLYFIMGYFLHKYSTYPNLFLSMCSAILWFFLAYYWKMHSLPLWIPTNFDNSIFLFVYKGITATLAILAIFSLGSQFLNHRNRLNLIVSTIGQLSLGIYVVHIMMLRDIKKVVLSIVPSFSIYSIELLCWSICILLSFVFVYLLNKSHFLSKVLLGKV